MKLRDTIAIIKHSDLADLELMQENYIKLSSDSSGTNQRRFVLLNTITSKRITELRA